MESARELSPTSDGADAAPVSKMRRQWRLNSTKATSSALLPMEDSPGSSGATSSWQMVAPPPAPHFDVESVSDGEDTRSPSVCFDGAQDFPASMTKSVFQPAPKPKAWQRPSVCLRFNSPFQVDKPEPKPVAKPAGSRRRFKPHTQWIPQPPLQRERVAWGAEAAPLPSFSNAHMYAKYPSRQVSCPIDSTLRCPTPAPLPPRVEPPGAPATKAAAFKAPRTLVEEAGFSRSLDAHADLARRNHLLFEQLCDMHVELSPVLGQIAASRHGEVLRSKLLAKVSDTTAARYFRSVQIFFTTLEELGGDIHNVEAGLLLDTFFSLSRCPEEGPLSNSLNVMKALRWYRKLLDLSPFPDLYSAAFASLVQPASGEKRESLPLPLSFHAFLERKVLDSATPQTEAIWAGSFLACVGGSLRFSDAQHVLWSSLCISHFTLRGICYRTKTTKRGAPFAFLGFGAHSTSREFGENWLSVWILLLDNVWQELRSSFGAQVTPDCFFFTVGKQGFAPASYAQTLLRLRNFLQEAGVAQAEALSYTLHSMKVTMLSWMAQLDLPLPARTLQGHHALAGSMQLYSRDDVWPGPLCAPSFQFGRPSNVDLPPCFLSIVEDRTRFRRACLSCQVFPRHGGPLPRHALSFPRTLSLSHHSSPLPRPWQCPAHHFCNSRRRSFRNHFAGPHGSRTRMAIWGLRPSTPRMIKTALQVPQLGKAMSPLRCQPSPPRPRLQRLRLLVQTSAS